MKEYLVIGASFWVFGIRFLSNIMYVYIFNDEHLIEVPIELFEIIDDKIPNEWRIQVSENGETTLWPELFYRDDFLENFAEREIDERSTFEGLRVKIER